MIITKLKKWGRFLFWKTVYIAYWITLPVTLALCVISKYFPKKFDIGIGPVPLINNVYIASALKQKGYTTQSFCNKCYFITNEFDLIMEDSRKGRLLLRLPAIFMFYRYIFTYRCIYTTFDGALQYKNIPFEKYLYKLAGVKTVVMPYGSDSQDFSRATNKKTVGALCCDYEKFFRSYRKRISQNIQDWCRYADIVIGTMDSVDYLHFWNRITMCYFAIDTDKILPKYKVPSEKIVILHAPNHTQIKGSKYIKQAVERLQAEGYSVELVFKQGVSNAELLEHIARADIVVDQLIMGMYAMFAIEAMALGKPVICYLREDLLELYSNAGCFNPVDFPIINAVPSTIYNVLKNLVCDKVRLQQLGRRSRNYCEKYHSLSSIGDFFDKINRDIGISPSNTYEKP